MLVSCPWSLQVPANLLELLHFILTFQGAGGHPLQVRRLKPPSSGFAHIAWPLAMEAVCRSVKQQRGNCLRILHSCCMCSRLVIPHVGVRLFLVRKYLRYLRCMWVLTDRDKALLYAPVSPRYGFEVGAEEGAPAAQHPGCGIPRTKNCPSACHIDASRLPCCCACSMACS
jgi:hypothetical protein